MKKYLAIITIALAFNANAQQHSKTDQELSTQIANDKDFQFVKDKALEIISEGFTAGDGYREVWIRDYNTFISIASKVYPKEECRVRMVI